ncbi:molybdenum cofactor biosynthesis protein MoaE [Naumannella sp. ID2617S]|uniref:Molybdopterin synthase n=1 Tax=Enemella dayhoffiae TaxID=2016507 RepID=A0A255GX73_9ACTN|nr:molybdenum cofactor biosynthesis protein MoaE [Naumannella sp. ID2617S]OYO19473.1 molybdopterin synthase [Enemella dayhoffiae]
MIADPLSVDRVLNAVRGPSVGGVGIFVGIVRDIDDGGRGVVSLEYSAHPSAAAELARVAEEVAARHDVLAVATEHRVGQLALGELAVVVAAGAVHRGPALKACRDLIDTLKRQVPIWKSQEFTDGQTEWVGLP